jgi:hypothetical protein
VLHYAKGASMSWFAKILNWHGASTRRHAKDEPVAVEPPMPGDRFVHIKACDFFGQHARSPNGRFIVAWSDHHQQDRAAATEKAGMVAIC